MRITIINQFYIPDLAPTGHLAASLAEHRAAKGDVVTVITSRGGYMGQQAGRSGEEDENPHIIRVWTPALGKKRAYQRLIDYASFYLLTILQTVILPRQDVIISLTTPPFIVIAALLHKLMHPSTRVVLWSMDCYPEVVERAGLLKKNSVLSRLMRWLNTRIFHRLDHLVSLDTAMHTLLTEQYVEDGRPLNTSIIPNWEVASQFPRDLDPPVWAPSVPVELTDQFVVLYLGNAGYGHRFETVIQACEYLKEKEVVFLFVGGGEKWTWLEQKKQEKALDNLVLHPYVPKSLTPSVMAVSDCALITLHEDFAGVISPSKLHANLAMSMPVIYVGPRGSNVDDAIQKFDFGVSLRHGDVNSLTRFIQELMNQPVVFTEYQDKSRNAFEASFTDEVNLPRFDDLIDNA